jgi:hypothetical protein
MDLDPPAKSDGDGLAEYNLSDYDDETTATGMLR